MVHTRSIRRHIPEDGILEAVCTVFHIPTFKIIARATLQLSNKHEGPALVLLDFSTALTMTASFHILSDSLFIKSSSLSSLYFYLLEDYIFISK
jgi:hypothetical protein